MLNTIPPLSLLSDAELLQRWRSNLRERLRESSEPLFASGEDLCPAASLWVMMRHEVERLRHVNAESAPLPMAASIAGLATILAALWLGIDLRIDITSSPRAEAAMGVEQGYIRALKLMSGPILDLPAMVIIPQQWGTEQILRDQLLPGILSAEIICLGPCHPWVESALRG